MEINKANAEAQILKITRDFLKEQEIEREIHAFSIHSSLEQQLGIDSLGKVELFHRVEKAFGIHFSDSIIATAQTLNDILIALSSDNANVTWQSNEHSPSGQNHFIDTSTVNTLQDALIQHATTTPDRIHMYFQEENGKETPITYETILKNASRVANGLIARGVCQNDTVAIMLPTSKNFFYSFFGILLAGAIPVPIYPPYRPDRIEEYVHREQKILNSAEVRVLITFSRAEKLSKVLQSYIPSLKLVTTAENLFSENDVPPGIKRTADDISLIQYTSGSTGDPKGVLLHHKNMIANINAIVETIHVTPTDSVVSWLPLYHDMGLLSWISSLFHGVPFTIMPTFSFLTRPERWLWAIHHHRATISAGPNFAYELCAKRIDEESIVGLDLSSWRLAFNGAEAVNPKTLQRFYQRFKNYGFKNETFHPVYGLAENTVAVTFPELGRGPLIDNISFEKFTKEGQAIPTSDEKDLLQFVCEGKPIANHEIRIVNDNDELLPERKVGNLQFRGPSAMQGYYHNPKATQQAYHDGWWATGDRGYLVDGELYITGRIKDIIIKGGRNLHPEPIEEIVSNVNGVRKGCVVAFGVSDEKTGTERIIIVTESHLEKSQEKEQLQNEVIEQVSIGTGVPPDKVVIVAPRSIPKTSSGKLQRSECKQLYLTGELGHKPKTLKWQIAKLFINSIFRRIVNGTIKTARFIYSLYTYLFTFFSFLIIWAPMFMAPQKTAHRILKSWAKLVFTMAGCPIKTIHPEKLQEKQPVIYVANHASYVDSLVLLAILPVGTIAIGKKELARMPIVSIIIKKLKFLTVDRVDFSKNIEGFQEIQSTLEKLNNILIFPEGTFAYAKGLRPFKVGAFQLAVNTQTPICPLAITGTRQYLRSGGFLLSLTRLKVTVCDLIIPQSKEWSEVIKMRNQARKVIAENCAEPVIDLITANQDG